MRSNIFRYAGVVCIPIYILFTFVSHLFNTGINPLANWLSDYGDPTRNPSGALFYNVGCIIVALLLAAFYIGMNQWYRNRKLTKKYVISIVGAQISGIIASAFLVLASVFPLGADTPLHSFFSTINMIGMDSFMVFTAIAFFVNPNMKRWIGVYACLLAAFNIVTMNAFSSLYISEWIYFLLFMVYMVILTFSYDKLKRQGTESGKQESNSGISVESQTMV